MTATSVRTVPACAAWSTHILGSYQALCRCNGMRHEVRHSKGAAGLAGETHLYEEIAWPATLPGRRHALALRLHDLSIVQTCAACAPWHCLTGTFCPHPFPVCVAGALGASGCVCGQVHAPCLAGLSSSLSAFAWLPWYPDTCVWLDNNQPAGWDVVISLSLSLPSAEDAGAAQPVARRQSPVLRSTSFQ